jgi:cyclopropane fatty-acyl-phospholipid synthase-like methyltransferase
MRGAAKPKLTGFLLLGFEPRVSDSKSEVLNHYTTGEFMFHAGLTRKMVYKAYYFRARSAVKPKAQFFLCSLFSLLL